jgi:hypothetical protein
METACPVLNQALTGEGRGPDIHDLLLLQQREVVDASPPGLRHGQAPLVPAKAAGRHDVEATSVGKSFLY